MRPLDGAEGYSRAYFERATTIFFHWRLDMMYVEIMMQMFDTTWR